MLIHAPNRVTLSDAALFAKLMALVSSAPRLSATHSAPQKVSPAAVVSTTFVL